MADADMLAHYSRALDEIYRLRQAMAIEAVQAASVLQYSTLPVRARDTIGKQIDRMRRAARGEAEAAYWAVSSESRQWAMDQADAPDTLTRGAWEEEGRG